MNRSADELRETARQGCADRLGDQSCDLGAGAVREVWRRARAPPVRCRRSEPERAAPVAARFERVAGARAHHWASVPARGSSPLDAARMAGAPSCGSGDAWRHTFTNRCTAVNAVSTSMIHSTGTRMSNARPDAEEHEPLGALHEPAAGVEAERLGAGPARR